MAYMPFNLSVELLSIDTEVAFDLQTSISSKSACSLLLVNKDGEVELLSNFVRLACKIIRI